MEANYEKVLALLRKYISSVNAQALLMRALRDQGLSPSDLQRGELRKCRTALRRGMELFVDPARRVEAIQELNDLIGADSMRPGACSLDIKAESDIGRVRSEARRICDAVGANAFTMQKVATIVSELARNMVLYANGGAVEITAANSGPRRIVVRAVDRGPGIRNLDEVFSGRYKSKTGMGRGLLGTKRLADRFDISTGSNGTSVLAEVMV